ncbi:MAG: hypothetical protein AAB594_00955 [Patescibacteria group bacterium]
MIKTSKKTSNDDDVLHALSDLSEAIGVRFDKVDASLHGTYDRFEKIDRQLLEMRGQLDRIETIVLHDHERRIESLEKQVRSLK